LTALQNLFGRGGRASMPSADAGLADLAAEREPAGGRPLPPPSPPSARWPRIRIGIAGRLWGDGFVNPGGSAEVLRLAVPIGLSEATSLLMIGAGAGGPPHALAAELGTWVSAYESDAALAALAAQHVQRSGAVVAKHASVEPWDPAAPEFRQGAFHHAIAFDALHESPADAVLRALRDAIKPSGQLVLQELVADRPLDPADPSVSAWRRLEYRKRDLPTEAGITAQLEHLRFEVRVTEDQSDHHISLVLQGWQDFVQSLQGAHPSHLFAEALVNEAELWARRISLMHAGRIRLVRWHAFAKEPTPRKPRA